MPSRSMAGATSCIWETFSSSVRRPTRSRTRCSNGRSGFRHAGAGLCAPAVPGARRDKPESNPHPTEILRRHRRIVASCPLLPATCHLLPGPSEPHRPVVHPELGHLAVGAQDEADGVRIVERLAPVHPEGIVLPVLQDTHLLADLAGEPAGFG